MTPFRRLIVLLAGLWGAAGVAAAAVASHNTALDGSDAASLSSAAQFLMIGGAALAGAVALGAASGRRWSFADASAGIIALGTALFSGAIASRVLLGIPLFPMAAPTGGTMLIAGWIVLALCAFQSFGGPERSR